MSILLVRHAHAGTRSAWHGPDEMRPLSSRGSSQARGLSPELAPLGPARIVSSPTVRCIQTVTPLAMSLNLSIEWSASLCKDEDERAFVTLVKLAGGTDPVVVCTHGEVIERFQVRLTEEHGVDFGKSRRHEKGSTWVLETSAGRFVSAEYLPPPNVASPTGVR